VRNVEKQPNSFWLQTSTDKLYPDFVAKLKNERTLVVEYKGAGWMGAPDVEEKEKVGKLWAERSDGKCIFLLVGPKALGDITVAVR
jgi:type III restriction enzyme